MYKAITFVALLGAASAIQLGDCSSCTIANFVREAEEKWGTDEVNVEPTPNDDTQEDAPVDET